MQLAGVLHDNNVYRRYLMWCSTLKKFIRILLFYEKAICLGSNTSYIMSLIKKRMTFKDWTYKLGNPDGKPDPEQSLDLEKRSGLDRIQIRNNIDSLSLLNFFVLLLSPLILVPWDPTIFHNDPTTAPKDHCERFRIWILDLGLTSLVH